MIGDFTGKPTAAPAIWPYPHRTVAQVDRREAELKYNMLRNRRIRAGHKLAAQAVEKIDLSTAPSAMEQRFSRASVLRPAKDSG